jgi:hypothetical protein
MDMPFSALFWPDMPFNALFWPDMPFNTPEYLKYFAYAGFSGQGTKKIKKSKTGRLTFLPPFSISGFARGARCSKSVTCNP